MRVTLVISILILVAGCATSQRSPVAADEVRARSRAVAAAEAAEELETVMQFWMPDAVVHVEGAAPVVGDSAIRTMYEGMFPLIDSFRSETGHVEVSGDLAYETGTNYMTLKSGNAVSKYVAVWKRGADGKWRIAALSVTNNAK